MHNAIAFLTLVLWQGGISIPKFKLSVIIPAYTGLLSLGSLLGLAMGRFDSWTGYWPYLGRVAGVGAALFCFYAIAAWEGNRRLNQLAGEPKDYVATAG